MDTFAPRILTNGFCKLKMWRGGKKERKREISFLEHLLNSYRYRISALYAHWTNWNIVSILNGGYKLHGSLIFNNDIIKRIIEIYPYDASLPIERNVVSLSNDFQNKFAKYVIVQDYLRTNIPFSYKIIVHTFKRSFFLL